jgi:hypothetical protein
MVSMSNDLEGRLRVKCKSITRVGRVIHVSPDGLSPSRLPSTDLATLIIGRIIATMAVDSNRIADGSRRQLKAQMRMIRICYTCCQNMSSVPEPLSPYGIRQMRMFICFISCARFEFWCRAPRIFFSAGRSF